MLVIDLKDKVAEGEYDVLVVLDEKKEEQKKVDLPSFNFPVNPYSNYSREEIYSEDGRWEGFYWFKYPDLHF